jgi:hypothetical protein
MVSVMVAAVHPGGSFAVIFTAVEHLVSASGIVVVASEIGVLHLHQHLCSVHLRWLEKLVRL